MRIRLNISYDDHNELSDTGVDPSALICKFNEELKTQELDHGLPPNAAEVSVAPVPPRSFGPIDPHTTDLVLNILKTHVVTHAVSALVGAFGSYVTLRNRPLVIKTGKTLVKVPVTINKDQFDHVVKVIEAAVRQSTV